MKRTIYSLTSISFIILLSSAVNSFKNTTLVLPPNDKVLELPDQMFDYSVELPQHVFDMSIGWGTIDTALISNITDEKATLGRVLFYDDRLSDNNSLSCASCHRQELSFADDVALSEGIGDQFTTRNSMHLNDLAWQLGQSFFWDFRSGHLHDAVIQPILASHELGKTMDDLIAKLEAAEEYESLFMDAYGSTSITESKIAESLAVFISSMTTFESKFDQSVSTNFSNFTASELNGKDLFELNCAFCHVTPHFGATSPFQFFVPGNNGLDSVFTDLGAGEWFQGPMFEGLFKSPSLKNIEVTGPYMHDGRFATLEEVIDFYSEGVQFNDNSAFRWLFGDHFTGYNFSESEKQDLISFLKTLTDDTFLTHEKWSDPWQSIVSISPEFLEGVEVFPNPVADMITVNIENPSGANYDVSIFDINGKLLESFHTSGSVLNIPRGNAPAGIYELIAKSKDKQKTFKLVYR